MNRQVRRLGSLALGLAALWLVSLHALFLWRRVADATIQQPGILARWIASAILISGALVVKRYAVRHWHRRHTTAVFWFLVLLLHVSIPAEERILGSQEILLAVLAVSPALIVITARLAEAGVVPIALVTAAAPAGMISPRIQPAAPRAPPSV